jgi:hypothetical protein
MGQRGTGPLPKCAAGEVSMDEKCKAGRHEIGTHIFRIPFDIFQLRGSRYHTSHDRKYRLDLVLQCIVSPASQMMKDVQVTYLIPDTCDKYKSERQQTLPRIPCG